MSGKPATPPEPAPRVDVLKLHPRTALWWQQREVCRQCANLLVHFGSTAWKCRRSHGSVPGGFLHCIDSRDPGGCCGPDAALFVPGFRAPARPPA